MSASLVSRRFVLSVYLKQLTHFILYLSLFGDNSERVVANKLRIKETNGRCFVFVSFYQGEVTTKSDRNLRGSTTRITYLESWCYTRGSFINKVIFAEVSNRMHSLNLHLFQGNQLRRAFSRKLSA